MSTEANDTIGLREAVASARSMAARLRPRRLRTKPLIAIVLITLLAVTLLVGPQVVSADPVTQSLVGRLKPPGWTGPDGVVRILGTDQLGRDVLARILAGARLSIVVAAASVTTSLAIGVPFGILAGFYGGLADKVLMRLTDAQLAFPVVLFAIVIATAIGPSIPTLILVLALTAWTRHARVVYGMMTSLKARDYVLAARALGATDLRLMARHLLPNAWSPIVVISAFLIGRMVLLEAALSFLGIGVPPPNPSLGNILSDGQDWIWVAPWLSTYPGLALVFIMVVTNFVGDVLRSVAGGAKQAH